MTSLALIRTLAYAIFTLSCMPIQVMLLLLRSPARSTFPVFYHRLVLRILGIRLDVRGKIEKKRPCLFVCNHTSYLDIEILGALIAGSFVSKADVAKWPFFGTLARLQRTVFVERQRSKVGQHRDLIQKRLESGDRLILFPEGTTGTGNRILPFKRSLFAVAQNRIHDQPVPVQPVSVTYARFSNLPMDRGTRTLYAWYGNMELVPHIWRMLRAGVVTVVVQYHQTVTIEQFENDRRKLSEYCFEVINDGHVRALTGRLTQNPRRPSLQRIRQLREAARRRGSGLVRKKSGTQESA